MTVSVRVKNTGLRSGDEVVQLYIRDDVASVTRPAKELKGFRRVSLKPDEANTVEFVLRPADLMFYDLAMHKVIEPGTFTVFVGSNSADVLETRVEMK